MDNSLRVNPDELQRGAQRLSDVHNALRSALTKVRDAHDTLRGSWAGGAATTGNAMWTGLDSALSTHLEDLADNADKLCAAAGLYRGQDGESADAIGRQL